MHTTCRVGGARVSCRVAACREGRRSTIFLGCHFAALAAFPAALAALAAFPASLPALAATLAGRYCISSTATAAFGLARRRRTSGSGAVARSGGGGWPDL
tara:strand:- start:194 stop:493 length:300 start_codon:yes stop_codon:yes gene_type:complete